VLAGESEADLCAGNRCRARGQACGRAGHLRRIPRCGPPGPAL